MAELAWPFVVLVFVVGWLYLAYVQIKARKKEFKTEDGRLDTHAEILSDHSQKLSDLQGRIGKLEIGKLRGAG